MTDAEILEQIFENDEVVQDFKLSEKTPVVQIRTVGYKDQGELEDFLAKHKDEEMTDRKFLQMYSLEMLSRTVLTWGTKRFKDRDEAREFLSNKPIGVLNRLIQAQQELESRLKKALGSDDAIKDTFFPKEKPLEESDPSPAESTQERKEA